MAESIAESKPGESQDGGLLVKKEVTVLGTVESAFRRFTEGIGSWWPLETHSVSPGDADAAVFETWVGGRVYERQKDGTEALWGTVTAWDPPRRFAMTWHPGRDAETATRLEVHFDEVEEGTRLRLTHTGWEVLGEEAAETCREYYKGWDPVLARFALGLSGPH
jgi:hypothetical protein